MRKRLFLSDLLKKVARLALFGSNFAVAYSLAEDLWWVEADAEELDQVIQNLITNAAQALPPFGGHIYIKAVNARLEPNEIDNLTAGDYILLTIQDNGAGIREEHLPHIFEPYFTTKPGSSGIGLTVCYSIIAKYKGYIEVRSVLGEGTTFQIYLPAIRTESLGISQTSIPVYRKAPYAEDLSPATPSTVAPTISRSVMTTVGQRILVVDDEVAICRLLQRCLSKFGYEPASVETGGKAIEQYRLALEEGRPFNAVITDLTLPDNLGGALLAKELLKIDPQATLLLSSGYSNDEVMVNYGAYGFQGTIPKPYEFQELLQTLKRCLRKD